MKFLMIVSVSLLLSACAHLKSEVQNMPYVTEPSGNALMVFIGDDLGNDIGNSFLGAQIKGAATKWAVSRGYVPVQTRTEAHTLLSFSPWEKERTVDVPGQTYSVPIYGQQNYTSTVQNRYGQTVGTINTQPSNPFQPSGYQTHYREAYSYKVVERSLRLQIWRAERGTSPIMVTKGVVYPSEYDMKFFESAGTMENAVNKLLAESFLGSVPQAPKSKIAGNPGCWPRLGITYDHTKKDKREIASFSSKSKAKDAGLKIGDDVVTFNGSSDPATQFNFKEGDSVPLEVMRGQQKISLRIPATTICHDEP